MTICKPYVISVTLKKAIALTEDISIENSIYVTNAPPLGNNTNSENEFVLFFAADCFVSLQNAIGSPEFCRFGRVAQLSRKSMRKIIAGKE